MTEQNKNRTGEDKDMVIGKKGERGLRLAVAGIFGIVAIMTVKEGDALAAVVPGFISSLFILKACRTNRLSNG